MDDQPVTRTQLLEALAATKAELKAELSETMAANKAEIIEVVRDTQTEVLRAFFSYQQAQSVKFQHLEAEVGNTTVAMRKRMDILEQRLAEIEKRILPIPPAA